VRATPPGEATNNLRRGFFPFKGFFRGQQCPDGRRRYRGIFTSPPFFPARGAKRFSPSALSRNLLDRTFFSDASVLRIFYLCRRGGEFPLFFSARAKRGRCPDRVMISRTLEHPRLPPPGAHCLPLGARHPFIFPAPVTCSCLTQWRILLGRLCLPLRSPCFAPFTHSNVFVFLFFPAEIVLDPLLC